MIAAELPAPLGKVALHIWFPFYVTGTWLGSHDSRGATGLQIRSKR
jgi:hypothetical protein